MAFQPLTQDQFQKARAAGYSVDQIVQFETQRKASGGSPSDTFSKKPQAGFTDPLHKMDPTGTQSKAFIQDALPLAGSAIGTIAGGAIGGLVTAPTILGVPAGIYGGAVAGADIGGTVGSAASQAMTGSINAPQALKTGLEFGGLEAVGGPVTSVAGKLLEATGAGLAKAFIPTSEREAGLLQTYKAKTPFLQRVANILTGGSKAPTTAASTAFDKGLMGTESMIGVQARRASTRLWTGLISPALRQSDKTQDMGAFFDEYTAQIMKNTKELGDQSAKLEALDSIKAEYAKKPTATMEDLQGYKEGWASHVPQKYYNGKDISGIYNQVRAGLSDLARTKIYAALGDNVKQAYFDYGNLKGLMELGKKAMAGSKLKGGAGSFIHGLWEMATVPVGTVGGQVIYKVGQGIEFAGPPGVKTLGALLGVGQTNQSAPTQQSSKPPTEFPGLGAPSSI